MADKVRGKTELQRESEKVNSLLKAEAARLELGTKRSLERMEGCKHDPSSFSYWAELEFREYVRRMLERQGSASAALLVNGGARMLKLSSVTTKRYLSKLRAERGPFSGLGDVVILNPNYCPAEDDEYWMDAHDGT